MEIRLILDGAHQGAWNMALDEALLESAAEGGPATLRIYRWSEPTLSLGYFQSHTERTAHPASLDCPLVRRSSGGGAILHDREWTYSFTAPVDDRISSDVQALYRTIHGSFVRALGRWGLAAKMWKPAKKISNLAEPFLCFQRRADGDVVLDGYKVCGSAQRRRRRGVLQHGSILWGRSEKAPELLGIQEVASSPVDPNELLATWLEELRTALDATWRRESPTEREQETATELAMKKHANGAWLARK